MNALDLVLTNIIYMPHQCRLFVLNLRASAVVAAQELHVSKVGALQARDDSIAGFQMLQQQSPSPGQKERLAKLASQLEDTEAQLLTTQAGPSACDCQMHSDSRDTPADVARCVCCNML